MLSNLLKILLVVDLVAVNAWLIYQFSNSNFQISSKAQNFQTQNEVKTEYVDRCGEECLAAIAARVEELESRRAGVSPTVAPTAAPTSKPVVKTTTVAKKTRKEEVLTIPGSGSTRSTDWENLSGTEFYFDTRDYPGLLEVYFEANMKLVNGGGRAYVRLFDITNSIAPVGGQNDTISQTDTWTKSQKVYFWAGKNLIRVQAKSQIPDTAVYNQGRLRIVTEN